MSPDNILRKFETTHATWHSKLDGLDEVAFVRRPAEEGWSIGQICHHLGSVSAMLLGNAVRCADGDGAKKRFSFLPWMITAMGSFPPTRIRLPELPAELRHMAEPEPMTKDAGLARLDGTLEQMRAVLPAISAAPPGCRREHPAGGWPNARQWYQMNEMHLRHHLRQLARLTA